MTNHLPPWAAALLLLGVLVVFAFILGEGSFMAGLGRILDARAAQ